MGRAQTTNVGTRGPEKPSGLGAPTLRSPPCARSKANFTCRGRDNHPQERRKEEKGVTLSMKKGGARKKDAENGRNSIKEIGKGVRKRRNEKKRSKGCEAAVAAKVQGGPH